MRIAIALLALLLVACTSPAPSEPPPAASASPTSKRTQEFAATFTLKDQQLNAVGSDLEKTYGTARFTADVEFLDNTFKAEMVVASDYVKGNGTFEGFVTLRSPEGKVALRITGVATAGTQGEGSDYSGETEVIGGTGEYDTLAGRGRFSGQRTGAPGTPVNVQVSLEVINPK
jgi:hypothetical protein